MDIVAMSGQEAYMSVKGAADLDVVNNLPGAAQNDTHDSVHIDDGGTVTERILSDSSTVDIYV